MGRPDGTGGDGGAEAGRGSGGGSDPPTRPDDPAGGAAPRHRADETVRSESLPDSIRCPHCGEDESDQFAAFGSAVSVSQYYCRSCRTVFEAFKWR